MQIPRYVVGAFLFGLVWAAIQYTEGRITEFYKLAGWVLVFVVVGSVLSWGLSRLLQWYKNRR